MIERNLLRVTFVGTFPLALALAVSSLSSGCWPSKASPLPTPTPVAVVTPTPSPGEKPPPRPELSPTPTPNPTATPRPTATPTVGTQVLLLPTLGQATQSWCWAASMEMVMRFYGRPFSQCDAVITYTQDPRCCVAPQLTSCLVGARSLFDVQSLLNIVRIGSSYVAGMLAKSTIVSEIAAGRPIIMGYGNSFAGHVTVLYGYTNNGDFVVIHDPYFNQTYTVPYGQTVAYDRRYLWTQSLIGVRPF